MEERIEYHSDQRDNLLAGFIKLDAKDRVPQRS